MADRLEYGSYNRRPVNPQYERLVTSAKSNVDVRTYVYRILIQTIRRNLPSQIDSFLIVSWTFFYLYLSLSLSIYISLPFSISFPRQKRNEKTRQNGFPRVRANCISSVFERNIRQDTLESIVVGSRGGYRRQLVPIAATSGPLNQPPCRDSWRATSCPFSQPSLLSLYSPSPTPFHHHHPPCSSHSTFSPLSSVPSSSSFLSFSTGIATTTSFSLTTPSAVTSQATLLPPLLRLPPIHDPHLNVSYHFRLAILTILFYSFTSFFVGNITRIPKLKLARHAIPTFNYRYLIV